MRLTIFYETVPFWHITSIFGQQKFFQELQFKLTLPPMFCLNTKYGDSISIKGQVENPDISIRLQENLPTKNTEENGFRCKA